MAGIGSRTVGELERGEEKGYRDSLIAKLEKALQWPPGAVRSILDGGDPPAPGTQVIYVPEDAAKYGAGMHQAGTDPPPMLGGGLTPGQQVDAWLHPDSGISDRDRDALRKLVDAAVHLAEQAAVAHDVKRGSRPVDVPVLDATVKAHDHAR